MRRLRLRRVLATTWSGRRYVRGTTYRIEDDGEAARMVEAGTFEDADGGLWWIPPSIVRAIAQRGEELVVVRHGGLGDLMMLLPSLWALREAFPNLRLVLSCDGRYVPIMALPWLDEVISLEDGRGRESAAIDLCHFVERHRGNGNRPRYELFGEGLGVRPRPEPIAPCIVPEALAQARELVGPDDGRPLVILAPSGTTAVRALDYQPALDTARELVAAGAKVALVHPHSLGYGGEAGVVDTSGRTSVEVLVALVSLAAVAVAPDTGVLHVAGALGKPVVAIFTTWPSATRVSCYDAIALEASALQCHPCFDRGCGPRWCTGWIRPSAIVAAVAESLPPRYALRVEPLEDGHETWKRYKARRAEAVAVA